MSWKMNITNDYQMALLLQQQFQHEANIESPTNNLVYSKKKSKVQDSTKSLVDPSWELIDPTPNVHILFVTFNQNFFWNKLLAVCVSWSKRMTSCAGVCTYHGKGGLCHITLSEPLLKLRPRKDLVETLLHEMIHAFLFVTHNNKDRDGHGPEFHKHMFRINAEAGTNISVYHDFHDEVRLYKQHWWRCDGVCQNRRPFFGMLRRAVNRKPGPYDRWWAEHQRTCGGTFIKVKEPEKVTKKKTIESKIPTSPNSDIRKFFPVKNSSGNEHRILNKSSSTKVYGFKDFKLPSVKSKSNTNSTVVIPSKSVTTSLKKDNPTTTTISSINTRTNLIQGEGHVLSNTKSTNAINYEVVRNHWLTKFDNKETTKRCTNSNIIEFSKKAKHDSPLADIIDLTSDDEKLVQCPNCAKKCPYIDLNLHLDNCITTKSGENKLAKCPACDKVLNSDNSDQHVQDCLSSIFNNPDTDLMSESNLISCLVCRKMLNKTDLKEHLDECMDDDIFNSNELDETINEATIEISDSDNKYNCPVCFKLFSVNEMSRHLDTCLTTEDFHKDEDSVLHSLFNEPFEVD